MILDLITLIIVLYVIVNIISVYLFYADKRKAVKGNYRTKESSLIVAGFFGPFGAVIGMKAFRHKTRKAKFKVIYVFLALHLIGIAYWLLYIC